MAAAAPPRHLARHRTRRDGTEGPPAGAGGPPAHLAPRPQAAGAAARRAWRPVVLGVVAALGLAAGAGVSATGVGGAPALIAGPGAGAADPGHDAGDARGAQPAPPASIPGPGTLPGTGTEGTPGAEGASAVGAGTADPPEARRPDRPDGAPAFTVPGPAPPVEVEVPAIGVRSSLVRLRLDAGGALAAPEDYGVAGWFADGPQPGQPGPAVIAGHVDSRDGPGVFYRLADLAEGDEIVVGREGAEPVRFAVTRVEQYPKDAFPTASVYGPIPGPELRLITCGGTFDRDAGTYRDNIVVYASAIAT